MANSKNSEPFSGGNMCRKAFTKLAIISACAGLLPLPAMADALFGGDQGLLKSGSPMYQPDL